MDSKNTRKGEDKMREKERNKNTLSTVLLMVLFLIINLFGNYLIEQNMINSDQIFLLYEGATIFIAAFIGYLWIKYINKYHKVRIQKDKLKFNAMVSLILFIVTTLSFNLQLFLFEVDLILSDILVIILSLITNNYVAGFTFLYLAHSWISLISNKLKM